MTDPVIGDLVARIQFMADADDVATTLVPVSGGDDPFADLPDIIRLPDMTLDLTAYRIKIGDAIEYIQKHRGWQQSMEAWSVKLKVFADAIRLYLQEARNVPDEVRAALNDILVDTQGVLEACQDARDAANTSAQAAAGSASTATTKAAEANTSAQAAAGSVAAVNLPASITVADAGKSLRVKPNGSGYELFSAPTYQIMTEI